jgi:hypothetical protein
VGLPLKFFVFFYFWISPPPARPSPPAPATPQGLAAAPHHRPPPRYVPVIYSGQFLFVPTHRQMFIHSLPVDTQFFSSVFFSAPWLLALTPICSSYLESKCEVWRSKGHKISEGMWMYVSKPTIYGLHTRVPGSIYNTHHEDTVEFASY